MSALVQVEGLVKRYTSDGPNAVDDVTFDIQSGEVFALLGPNGAGKTTAISMISSLLKPTAGSVRVNGHDVTADPMAVRQSIGVAPQDLALYDDLSARENLRFWGQMRGLRGQQLKDEIANKLELTGLTDRAKDRVKTFSGGMKRRLNLAVGLLGNPPLIMLDEPTVAIDPQSRRYILDWVQEMNGRGLTVLYTTHYMEEAEELSHRIGIMDQGKLIALGTLQELTELVGEYDTLTLTLAQESAGDALAERLVGQDGILQASASDGQVVLNAESAEAALPIAMSEAAALGASIRSVDIFEPNLEAVFLHLTGRALRD